MTDVIVILVVLLIVGSAAFYIRRAKKQGQTCVGCPHSKTCGGKCGSNHS